MHQVTVIGWQSHGQRHVKHSLIEHMDAMRCAMLETVNEPEPSGRPGGQGHSGRSCTGRPKQLAADLPFWQCHIASEASELQHNIHMYHQGWHASLKSVVEWDTHEPL